MTTERTPEETEAWTDSPEYQARWAEWWRAFDETLAVAAAPPSLVDAQAAIDDLARALDLDPPLAKVILMRQLAPERFAQFMRRRAMN